MKFLEEVGHEVDEVMQPTFGLYISNKLAKMHGGKLQVSFKGNAESDRPILLISVKSK